MESPPTAGHRHARTALDVGARVRGGDVHRRGQQLDGWCRERAANREHQQERDARGGESHADRGKRGYLRACHAPCRRHPAGSVLSAHNVTTDTRINGAGPLVPMYGQCGTIATKRLSRRAQKSYAAGPATIAAHASVVIPRLQKVDRVVVHLVDQTIDTRDATRPDVGAKMFERLRLPDPIERTA